MKEADSVWVKTCDERTDVPKVATVESAGASYVSGI